MKIKICGPKNIQDGDQKPIIENNETFRRGCRKISKIIFWFLIAIVLFCIVTFTCLVINAYLLTTEGYKRTKIDANPEYLGLSKNESIEQAKRLLGAIKIDTMSASEGKEKDKYLNGIKELHKYIKVEYPNIHEAEYIEKLVVNDYSLIYRVQGTSSSKQVYMLTAHLDTVSDKYFARRGWYYDPYLGKTKTRSQCSYCNDVCPVDENVENVDYVHGKGAMQAKNLVFGILEALENLVKKQKRSLRTFYIAFGHDTKLDGLNGARKIKNKMVDMLQANEEVVEFVLDPGTSVFEDAFPSINDPLIYISVTEKGHAQLKLDMNSLEYNTVAKDRLIREERCAQRKKLSKALNEIVNTKQPFRYGDGPEHDTWIYASFYSTQLGYKLVTAHPWILSKLISMRWIDPHQVNKEYCRTITVKSCP